MSVTGNIRFVRSYPLASFEHIQNFELTPTDKDVRWMNISCAVCPVLVRQASCHLVIPRVPMKGRYDETFTGEAGILLVSCMYPSMSVRPVL